VAPTSRRTNRPDVGQPEDRQEATFATASDYGSRPDRNRAARIRSWSMPEPDGLRGVSMEASFGILRRPWRLDVAGLSPSGSFGLSVALASGSSTPASLPWFRSGLGYVVQRRPQSGGFRNCGQRQQRQLHGHQRPPVRTVTVDEAMSTPNYNGGTSASSGAVTTGGG